MRESAYVCALLLTFSGAPNSTRLSKTNLTTPLFLPILVVSFPSLQVPAPPSPKAKLLSGFIFRRWIREPM